jgi:hypothetical protein
MIGPNRVLALYVQTGLKSRFRYPYGMRISKLLGSTSFPLAIMHPRLLISRFNILFISVLR